MWIEILGIISSFIIFISMCFKTDTIKGTICLRSFNLIGSVAFVVYGLLLPSYATAFMNFIIIFINVYHMIKLIQKIKSTK